MGQAVPMIIMAAAAAAQGYNTYKTAKKQDQALLAGMRESSAEQRQADARMNATLDDIEGRTSGPIEGSMRQRYGDAARKKYAIAMQNIENQPGADTSGGEAKRESATGKAVDYGQFFADEYSKLDAPGDRRRLDAYDRLNMGMDVSVHNRNSRAALNTGALHARSIQRNPWIDIAAAVGNGVAGGMAGGYGKGGSIAGLGQQGSGFKGAWSNYGYGQNPYIIGNP